MKEPCTSQCTEMERRIAELTGALSDLEQLDRHRTHLIQNVSHDLRSPLALIHGYTDLLLSQEAGPLSEEQRQMLEIVSAQTHALCELVRDLSLVLFAHERPPE